jgi:fatty-acyl-CoA synthase
MGLYHGAKGVIAREFDPTKVLDFFEQSGITKLFMVPAAMQFVVRQPRAHQVDFSRLKYMFYGASPIPAALLKECIQVFKCGFVQMYGMTETTGTIVALPPEDHVEGLERMRSAGKAMPGIELAILDPDGNRLPPRQVGEIATRSGHNMVGYWNLPEATARTLGSDGWLRTGDAGYMDEDGYVYVMARTDDVINVAGHRLSTGAMEEVLAAHPDVAECAVIGVADELKGQVPLGFIVLKAGVNRDHAHICKEVVQMVRDRIGPVAAFRTATVVKRLPKTRSGKILRGTMQKIADGQDYKTPATIDDPAILPEIAEALGGVGYAAPRLSRSL